ncbi:BspA family leucine-rich repeat surface protein [Cognataquiflexum rubidum]|uniref:BspA family leucine-rich repeat surface protein n=1 Tax=Cognataquiflexum rubidum TaxID=2922273 RepID=UPI001F12E049|nr:BspA family leucine-rich repeat surface protein [Cognataquiflexum rubidum]MCH6236183.1 BspA family leucine-rich repeat surface protein [Cognataquiflexum rubidum]
MMRSAKLIPILLFTVFSSCEEETPVKTYTITKTATPAEGGEVYLSPGWLDAFTEGQRVAVIPVASEGWVFQQWQGDAAGTSNPYFFEMNSNKNIIGVFVKKVYTLDLEIIGEGTVTETIVENPSGREYFPGTIVELTPVPKEGWVFENWGAGGGFTGNEIPKRITVNEPIELTARFVPKPQGEPKFYLAENGITCKCENVIAGNKGVINGVEYEAVNLEYLRVRIREKVDLTKLCTSLVTDMSYLFMGVSIDQAIQNWDVSNVTNMEGMFAAYQDDGGGDGPVGGDGPAENVIFFNQSIGDWDVSNVTNMDFMFKDNFEFNQDLSKWCVSKIPTIPKDFASTQWYLPKPAWGTCPD